MMNRQTLTATVQVLRQLLNNFEAIQVRCLNCLHFDTTGLCQRHQARPPDDWVQCARANQCPDWEYDGVPF